MVFEYLKKIVINSLKTRYILIPKNAEGMVKDGAFSPCDLNFHIPVDKRNNLILEKGKYKILPREQSQFSDKDPIGMLVIDNQCDSYDKFWMSKEIVNEYLCKSRVDFLNEVFNICKEYFSGKVIEIGCGSGYFLKTIYDRNNNCELFGIDFSPSVV